MFSQPRTERKTSSNSCGEGVGHRDDADDHRTHVAKNSSKNQSLEGGACAHSFKLTYPLPARPPGCCCSRSRPERGTGATFERASTASEALIGSQEIGHPCRRNRSLPRWA